MSLDLINHKLTTSTTDEDGVITWSNPAVNIQITSKGKAVSTTGTRKKPSTSNNQFSFKYLVTDKQSVATFNSLYSRMVLGVDLCKHTIKLIDVDKGYTEGNTVILPNNFVHCSVIAPHTVKDSLLKLETNAERRFYLHYLESEHEQFYSTRTIQRYKKSFLLKYDINIYSPKY